MTMLELVKHLNFAVVVLFTLLHLQYKAFQKRTIALVENGSWAPCAAKKMHTLLDTMKDLTVLEQTVTIRSAVKPGDESALLALADAVHQA